MERFNYKKISRMIFLIIADALLIGVSLYSAYWLRFEGVIPSNYASVFIHTFWYTIGIKIVIFAVFGLYNSLWRYAGVDELFKVFMAAVGGTLVVLSINIFAPDLPLFSQLNSSVPRSIYIISLMIDILLIGGLRFSYRALRRVSRQDILRFKNKKRTLIIGAGDAGAMVIKELRDNPHAEYDPVAAVDDDPYKLRKRIYGVKVVGNRHSIEQIVFQKNIEEIIIAIPSLPNDEREKIIELCEATGIVMKTVPKVYDIISGKISISDIRPVDILDLLGREPIKMNMDLIGPSINGKKILITGGGGSIGSELARQIATYKPRELHILDIYENNAYDILNELLSLHKDIKINVIIASVRDKVRINQIFKEIKPDVVFHAAAHKHVPLMEANPCEAIKNNVFGTHNVVEASHDNNVQRFVMISTDKAVNPTNVMGASKRLCEMIVESHSNDSSTSFAVVRFGNVLGSNGSVIPLFKKQIAHGGPVTVTHKDIIRYFMTIPEAVQLVIQAAALSKGGELFVLDMGEQIKIDKLARDLIRLSGLEPDKDIEIVYTGLRPGEKLYEELLMSEEGLIETDIDKIYIAKRMEFSKSYIESVLKEFEASIDDQDMVIDLLKLHVKTYKPEII